MVKGPFILCESEQEREKNFEFPKNPSESDVVFEFAFAKCERVCELDYNLKCPLSDSSPFQIRGQA